MKYNVKIGGKNYQLELGRDAARWSCRLDGLEVDVDAIPVQPAVLSLRVGHETYEVKCECTADHIRSGSAASAMRLKSAIPAHCGHALAPQTTTDRGS